MQKQSNTKGYIFVTVTFVYSTKVVSLYSVHQKAFSVLFITTIRYGDLSFTFRH